MESTNSPKCMKIEHSHTFAYIFHSRAQRLAHKATQKKAIGTKAQQALKKTI